MLLLRAVAFVIARVPSWARAHFAWLLAFVFGTVLRHRRSHVELAMTRAGLDAKKHAPEMYAQLGRSIVELLALSSQSRDERARWIDERVTSPDEALIEKTMRAEGAVLILASHTGNWELVAAAAAQKWLFGERKLLFVVAKPLHSRMFDRFMRRLREDLFGLRTINPAGALREATRVLREGHVVVMPIDQVPEHSSHAVMTSFLGGDALVDRAPATLACRTKATVLVVAATRDAHHQLHHHEVHVIDRIDAPDKRDARAWIDDTTRRATRALERFVHAHPAGWLWLHRRWKTNVSHASVSRSIRRGAEDHEEGTSACRKAPVGFPSARSARL